MINEKLINFRVYKEGGSEVIGIATVDLPELNGMTEDVSGAGIAGQLSTPTLGHFESMKLTLNFRTLTTDMIVIAQQRGQAIECRGSIQAYDPATSSYKTVPVRVVGRGTPVTFKPGKLEPTKMMDASLELELHYFKLAMANVELVEIDKYNFICKMGGNDILATVRQDMGLMGSISTAAGDLLGAARSKIGI